MTLVVVPDLGDPSIAVCESLAEAAARTSSLDPLRCRVFFFAGEPLPVERRDGHVCVVDSPGGEPHTVFDEAHQRAISQIGSQFEREQEQHENRDSSADEDRSDVEAV